MKSFIVGVVLLVCCSSLVFAALSEPVTLQQEVRGSNEYTLEFYLAVGVAVVGSVALVLFVFFFFRRPKDSWEKNEEKKKGEQQVPFHRRFMRRSPYERLPFRR